MQFFKSFLQFAPTVLLVFASFGGSLVQRAVAADNSVSNPDPYANETPAQRDARMKWWREARFGMFIHWGVYSVPAGIYDGKQIPGIGEWIMNRGEIPVARVPRIREAIRSGEIQRRRLGPPREGSRHEIHRHHQQAS